MKIHPTAIIHKKAELDETVTVGPYAIIEEDVRIKGGTEIRTRAYIASGTRIGSNCTIHPGAIIGYDPQVRDLKETKSYLEIGDNNILREYVTIHRSMYEGKATRLGHNNFIMANVHIAHDCQIGSYVTLTNGVALAGHVTVEDKVFISGSVLVHQFVRIGRLSMIGGAAKVVQDIPPYLLIDGQPARVCGLNVVGLTRADISPEIRTELKKAYKILYQSGLNTSDALEKIAEEIAVSEELNHFIDFIKNSERGIVSERRDK